MSDETIEKVAARYYTLETEVGKLVFGYGLSDSGKETFIIKGQHHDGSDAPYASGKLAMGRKAALFLFEQLAVALANKDRPLGMWVNIDKETATAIHMDAPVKESNNGV